MIPDDDCSDEEDGYNETLVPESAQFATTISTKSSSSPPCPTTTTWSVYLTPAINYGTYIFKADGTLAEMDIDESFNFKKLFGEFGMAMNQIQDFLDDE
jgi:hypothetical protein